MFRRPRRTLAVMGSVSILATLGFCLGRPLARDAGRVERASLASRFLADLPSPTGLCVHVGVRDGSLAVGLAGEGKNLVHGLAASHEALDRARQTIEAAGLDGVVSVEPAAGSRLPYADNLVSVLVVDNLAGQLEQGFTAKEALRVLQPGGVAWLGQADGKGLTLKQLEDVIAAAAISAADVEIVEREGLWAKIRKARPDTMDVWTHSRRDATGNAVSKDKQVAVPTGVRWVAGPNWPTGDRKAAVPGVVASESRMVYLFESEPPPGSRKDIQNVLMARDPFNGLLLWRRPTSTRGKPPIVCVGSRVYTVIDSGEPLVALDADNGEVLRTYELAPKPEKVLYLDGRLIVNIEDGLGCLDAESGELLWKVEGSPKNFVAGDGRVFVHHDASRKGGPSAVASIDLKTGRELWRQPTSEWVKGVWSLVLYYDGVLVGAAAKGNYGVSAADGSRLWSHEYPLIGHGGNYTKIVALDGLVWVHAAAFEGEKRYAWEGLDPKSGKVAKRLAQPKDFSMKHRCSADVATERYFLCGSMDFADLETGEYKHFDAARNSCSVAGVLPANGLLYTFPHGCGCYPMLRGILGLSSDETPASADVLFEGERLVKGPAYGRPADEVKGADDWPMYRHDAERSGSTTAHGPETLKIAWAAEIDVNAPAAWTEEWDQREGGRLSAPVVASGLAFVAAADRHQLLALDARTGRPRWTFTAGGRIDCPPTLHQGLCLLGARDGWIYCLRASDGALAWRFRAAPDEKRIVAYGQLESPWPVVGGVLVHNGLAYFGVGRHAGSDGGIFVGALDPPTGKLLWAEQPEDYEGVPDVLTGSGATVQMAAWAFDAETGKDGPTKEKRLRGGRLGLLNDAWYERPLAMRRNLQLWTTEEVEGQIVAFNEQASASFRACTELSSRDGTMSGNAELSGKTKGGREWKVKLPLGVRMQAMALTPERLYVAGLFVAGKSEQASQPQVRAYALKDGKLLHEAGLDAPPVHDGLIVAGDRVYVATQGGRLVCLGE